MVQERPERVERRLSAILAADVAGYSRLMQSDKEGTHAKLTALLTEAVRPAIAEHGGRIVKNTGDGVLAEFPSAVEAVRAALQFQNHIHELTIGDLEDRRIAFRVGVNIGDVIVEPHDIFLWMALTSPRGWRASRSRAAFASRPLSTITFEAKPQSSSSIWASRASRQRNLHFALPPHILRVMWWPSLEPASRRSALI
jgi:hypothetical protein